MVSLDHTRGAIAETRIPMPPKVPVRTLVASLCAFFSFPCEFLFWPLPFVLLLRVFRQGCARWTPGRDTTLTNS